MAFEPAVPIPGVPIESSTDPSLNPGNRVGPKSIWLDISTTPATWYERNAANNAWLPVGPQSTGGGGSAPVGNYSPYGDWQDEFLTPTADQEFFTLTYPPVNLGSVKMYIDGMLQLKGQMLQLMSDGKTVRVKTPGIKITWKIMFVYARAA